MNRPRAIALLLITISVLCVTVGVSLAVPDARLSVDSVEVTPESPDPDETTTLEVAVANSAGSTSAVTVDEVVLRDDERTYATAENVSALSVGDDVTVPLSTAFEEAGVYDLTVAINATDEDDEVVTITHPTTVVVGGVDASGIEDDVAVEATVVDAEEVANERGDDNDIELDVGDLGGALPTTESDSGDDEGDDEEFSGDVLRIDVSNFGTATARSVAVNPRADNGSLPRIPVADLDPGDRETVYVDLDRLDGSTSIDVTAGYTLGTDRFESTTTYEYTVDDPDVANLTFTDVDLVAADEEVTISGNVANVGTAEVTGAVVEVQESEHVEPTYPQRDYFVGAVPESDFVGFDLTATVDRNETTAVPIRVTYLDDGVERETTVELEYDPREKSDDDEGRSLLPFVVAGGAGLAVLGMSALVWRRTNVGG